MHANEENPKIPCDQCDYKATREEDLVKHINLKHVSVKVSCDQCDYVGTKGSLSWHKNSKHGILKQCDQCDFVGPSYSLIFHRKCASTNRRPLLRDLTNTRLEFK